MIASLSALAHSQFLQDFGSSIWMFMVLYLVCSRGILDVPLFSKQKKVGSIPTGNTVWPISVKDRITLF